MMQLTQQFFIREQLRIVLLSTMVGVLIAILWSFHFVDSVIGDSIANGLLGYDAKETPIASVLMGVIFAFVSGLAGTFTACNVCVFSAIAPLAAEKGSMKDMMRPMLWMGIGLTIVAAAYGAIGVMLSSYLPQLSTAVVGPNQYPVRLVQASVVFTAIGLIFIVWGFMTLDLIRNPFARLSYRYPRPVKTSNMQKICT
jgi:hypothetical protein